MSFTISMIAMKSSVASVGSSPVTYHSHTGRPFAAVAKAAAREYSILSLEDMPESCQNVCILSGKLYAYGEKMKTTLDLPVDLLEEAMKESRCPTKTATIVAALEQLVRSAKLARLQSLRGSIPDFKLDLDTLRGRV
jgi:hypothetical protein